MDYIILDLILLFDRENIRTSFLITIIKTVRSLTLFILQNKTLKLSQFTLFLMVVKFVNMQGIKLL